MSKTIRVSHTTYHRLEAKMVPRESFEDVLTRLLDYYDALTKRRQGGEHGRQTMEAKRTKDSRAAGG